MHFDQLDISPNELTVLLSPVYQTLARVIIKVKDHQEK